MKTQSVRDNWPLILVLALIVLAVGLSAYLQRNIDQSLPDPFDSQSGQSNGTLGLYRWTESLGYKPARYSGRLAELPASHRMLFLLPARRALTRAEATYALDWAYGGNVLVYGVARSSITLDDLGGSSQRPADLMLSELRISLRDRSSLSLEPQLTQPAMSDIDTPGNFPATIQGLESPRADIVHLLKVSNESVLIAAPHGDGMVFVTSAPEMFTNDWLNQDEKWGRTFAGIIHSMYANLAPGDVVAFDESRRNPLLSDDDSLARRLYTTPWGIAILYGLLLLLGVLLLNGRRFGRPQPLPQEIVRRSPAEYVESMAHLFRRGNKRAAMLDHYRRQIKLRVGKPAGVDVSLDDKLFVEELRRVRDDIDAPALLQALRALEQAAHSGVSEAEMVRRVAEAQQLIKPQSTP